MTFCPWCYSLDFEIRWRSRLALLVEKNLLNVLTEKACDLDGQGETRIVPACLDGIDRLARDALLTRLVKARAQYTRAERTERYPSRSPRQGSFGVKGGYTWEISGTAWDP